MKPSAAHASLSHGDTPEFFAGHELPADVARSSNEDILNFLESAPFTRGRRAALPYADHPMSESAAGVVQLTNRSSTLFPTYTFKGRHDDERTPSHPVNELPTTELTSERFNATDADILFRSNDDMIFRVHAKNLEAHSKGFPLATDSASRAKVPIDLAEYSAILDLLFQFTYPQRPPNLADVPFSILSQLADAAEKYEVFSAMEICKFYMIATLPSEALSVFTYALKYGYYDVVDKAAPATIRIPLQIMATTLPPSHLVSWIKYYDRWLTVHENSCREGWELSHKKQYYSDGPCIHWRRVHEDVMCRLGSRPGSLWNLANVFQDARLACLCCVDSLRDWRKRTDIELRAIPAFSEMCNGSDSP